MKRKLSILCSCLLAAVWILPAQAAEPQQQPWLGVMPNRLPPLIGEHLGLPRGSGLTIEEILPESPAEKAGLTVNDILTQVGEQIVWTPEQLTAMMESHEPGDRVDLHILRAEEPMVLNVVLEPRPAEFATARNQAAPWDDGRRAGDAQRNLPGAEGIDEVLGLLRGLADQPDVQRQMEEARRQMENLQLQLHKQFDLEGMLEPGEGGNLRREVFRFDNANIQIKDTDGSIQIRRKYDVTILRAEDPEGNLLFEGPFDTDDDKDAVPPEIRERAERIQINRLDLGRLFDRGGEEDNDAPAGKKEIEGERGERLD